MNVYVTKLLSKVENRVRQSAMDSNIWLSVYYENKIRLKSGKYPSLERDLETPGCKNWPDAPVLEEAIGFPVARLELLYEMFFLLCGMFFFLITSPFLNTDENCMRDTGYEIEIKYRYFRTQFRRWFNLILNMWGKFSWNGLQMLHILTSNRMNIQTK